MCASQGKYSLRKAYWKELDLYHPRWNSRDLQIAEERYLRFCKASALTVQLPRWTKIFCPLNAISRIATCKVVLQIIRTVLFYAVFSDKSSASRSPDGVLLTALHLLSLALDICSIDRSSANACEKEDSFPVLTYASEEIYVGVVSGANAWKRQSLLSLLVALMRKYRKENEHNAVEASQCDFSSLIENLLKKLVELNTGCMAELQRLAPDVVGSLLQHPRSSSIQSPVSGSDAERKAKARERQAAILVRRYLSFLPFPFVFFFFFAHVDLFLLCCKRGGSKNFFCTACVIVVALFQITAAASCQYFLLYI